MTQKADHTKRRVQDFTYSNHMERPVHPSLRYAAVMHAGLRTTHVQIKTHADAWMESNRRATAESGPLWVVMGDSLAQGVGASTPDQGWVGQLHAHLQRQGRRYRVINLSVSGDRIGDVLSRQIPALKTLDEPDLITVFIGINDLFRIGHSRKLSESMQCMIENLPKGTIIANIPSTRPIAQAANELLHSEAAKRGLFVADVAKLLGSSRRGKLAADHAHPNDYGYADIAEIFAETIEARIRQEAIASKKGFTA